MKNKNTLLSLLGVIAIFLLVTAFSANLKESGGMDSSTGSPGDGGETCAGCHGGGESVNNAWITTDIPGAGYVPGQVYSVTLTVPTSNGKKGFSIVCENGSASAVGTFAVTNSATATVYGTHVTHQNPSPSVASWILNWNAPASGTGNVTFYVSFVKNGYSGGVVNASSTHDEGLNSIQNINQKTVFNVFPNPVSDLLNVELSDVEGGSVEVSVFSMTGQAVLTEKVTTNSNEFSKTYDLSKLQAGIYFIKTKSNGIVHTKKLVVR